MVASPINPRTYHHSRSKSWPAAATSNTILVLPQFDELLAKLRSSGLGSSVSHKLSSLTKLYECMIDLLQWPQAQQTLSLAQHHGWVQDSLNGTLILLDVCSNARDVLMQIRASAGEFQSVLRRRSNEQVIITEMCRCSRTMNKAKKEISRSLKNLRDAVRSKHNTGAAASQSTEENHDTEAVHTVLSESKDATLLVLESLFSLIVGSKASQESFISKIFKPNKVAAGGSEPLTNEFDQVSAILSTMVGYKTSRGLEHKTVEIIQDRLRRMDSFILAIEGELECLFRHMIKARVTLLNILNG